MSRPSARSVEILESVVWGTDGTRYLTPRASKEIDRLSRAHYFEARRGDTALGMYAVIPTKLVAGDAMIEAHYRSLLVVDPAAANAGVGRALSAAARKAFFDDAPSPAMLYGYIDTLNTRSIRVAERSGYRALFQLEPTAVGWFRPRKDTRVSVATSADLAEIEARLRAYWSGHVHGDFAESFIDGEYVVLRERGRIVAGAQMSQKLFSVRDMAGVFGKALLAAGPLLSVFSQTFATKARTMLWWGHYFEETPGALATLLEATQAHTASASGVTYLDPRSDRMLALRRTAFGPHVWAVPGGPKLAVMGATKGLADAPWLTLPFLASPLTCA